MAEHDRQGLYEGPGDIFFLFIRELARSAEEKIDRAIAQGWRLDIGMAREALQEILASILESESPSEKEILQRKGFPPEWTLVEVVFFVADTSDGRRGEGGTRIREGPP